MRTAPDEVFKSLSDPTRRALFERDTAARVIAQTLLLVLAIGNGIFAVDFAIALHIAAGGRAVAKANEFRPGKLAITALRHSSYLLGEKTPRPIEKPGAKSVRFQSQRDGSRKS